MRTLLLFLTFLALMISLAAYWLWQERDRVALGMMNRALAEYGVTVTRVRGFNLSAGRLRIALCEWQMAGDARVNSLRGLNARFRLRPLYVEQLRLQSIHIHSPASSSDTNEPISIADMHAQWRALPVQRVAVTTLRIDQHQVSRLSWQRRDTQDELSARYEDMTLRLNARDESKVVVVSATVSEDDKKLLTANAQLNRDGATHPVRVDFTADIGALWPRLRELPELQTLVSTYSPDIAGIIDGELTTSLQHKPVALASPMQIGIAPSSALKLNLTGVSVPALPAAAGGENYVKLAITVPRRASVEWQGAFSNLLLPQLGVTAELAGGASGSITVRDGKCASLEDCSGIVAVDAQTPSIAVDSMQAKLSAFSCRGSWSFRAEHVSFKGREACTVKLDQPVLDTLRMPELSATLSELRIRWPTGQGQPEMSTAFASDVLRPKLPDQWLPATRLAGTASLNGDVAAISGDVRNALRQKLFDFEATHNLASRQGDGSVSVEDLGFSTKAPLKQLLPGWPYPVDAVAGSIGLVAQLHWQQAKDGFDWHGNGRLSFTELAGKYDDIGAVGINLRSRFTLSAEGLTTTTPAELSIATLDIGVPLKEVYVTAAAATDTGRYTLHGLDARLLEGSVHADDFVYQATAESAPLSVRMTGISLSRVLELAAFKAVSGTGVIDGDLPLQIHNNTVTMSEGWLAGREPGVIRYTTSDSARAIAASNPSLQLVSEALSNYHYETLRADATLDRAGDLKLAVTMRGVNPDMRGGQRINLNLNVSNNIPQLLRTLRAGRIVDDMLARHLNKSR